MDRRGFLETITGISALLPGLSLLAGAYPEAFAQDVHARAQAAGALRTLTAEQDALVTLIADMLLPHTDTIGASAVGVDRFIDLLLTESMLEAQRDRFLAGLAAVEARSVSLYGTGFRAARREQQESLLRSLDSHPSPANPSRAEAAARAARPITAEDAFAVLKALVVLAYFTSEPVAKQLINAPIIPGKYEGCVPL
jgi:gluconate 2-dehydrogenase gamma chain